MAGYGNLTANISHEIDFAIESTNKEDVKDPLTLEMEKIGFLVDED